MNRRQAERGSGPLCAGAYCGNRRRIRRPGLLLCAVCLSETSSGLRQLAPLYQACGRLLGGGAQRCVRDKVSGSLTPGMRLNSAAAETRSSILSVLASWSGLVAEESRVRPPDRTAAALADFLLTHVMWLAAHEAAPELTREIRQLVGTASTIAFPNRRRRIRLGSCPESNCGGSLYATIHSQEALLPAEIGCDSDPAHTWPARAWLSLNRRISQRPDQQPGQSASQWLSAADISRLRDTRPGNVYRLASERRWRRRREAGHTYYYAPDVEQTLGFESP